MLFSQSRRTSGCYGKGTFGDEPLSAAIAMPAHHVAVNVDRTLVAFADQKKITFGRDPDPTPIGMTLASLPDLSILRTVVMDRHAMRLPALSKDGSLLAVFAQRIVGF